MIPARPRRTIASGMVLLAAGLLAGCGDSESTEPEPRTVVQTVERTTTVAPAPTTTSDPVPSAPDDAAAGGRIRVPDVEGQDHQLAQDTLQAAGLYSLAEEDATGQGRLLLYDRNWTVVEQDPPAGARVSADTTITLRSKKDGE